jgi:predicted RNase H-like nuclease (RuvC/YqgF family)
MRKSSSGDSINQSVEQPKLTKVASSSSDLEKHRKWAGIVEGAEKYQRSQEGEASKRFFPGQSKTNDQVSALNSDAANLLEPTMDDINNLGRLVYEKLCRKNKILKQENEGLKQENEGLKQENEDLKQEIEKLKEKYEELKQKKQYSEQQPQIRRWRSPLR